MEYFQQRGFEVLAVSADGPEVDFLRSQGIMHKAIPMTRKITPFQDLICLYRMIMVVRQFKPSIIHSHTPKAGLIAMMAGLICNVPVRMHTVAGLPLMESSGLKRKMLTAVERITYFCATQVYSNSVGLGNFINEEVSARTSVKIIASGSTNGININTFTRTAEIERQASDIRLRYGITPGDFVFCFVGRVVKDKGIHELLSAFRKLASTSPHGIFLLLVGPLEPALDPLDADDLNFISNNPQIIMAGFQNDVKPWLVAADVFVFPSYREGFPNVVMQASCLGVPSVVSDINGSNEIIQNGISGIVVKPKNPEELHHAMKALLSEPETRASFAEKARTFVSTNFSHLRIWQELEKEYLILLERSKAL